MHKFIFREKREWTLSSVLLGMTGGLHPAGPYPPRPQHGGLPTGWLDTVGLIMRRLHGSGQVPRDGEGSCMALPDLALAVIQSHFRHVLLVAREPRFKEGSFGLDIL